MEVSKKYLKISENPHDKSNFLKIEIYYDIGGMNYFTGHAKARGYYLSVCPVERARGFESFTAFTGVCELLTECTRKGKKAEAQAMEKAPAVEKMMIDYILKKYGYVLEAAEA